MQVQGRHAITVNIFRESPLIFSWQVGPKIVSRRARNQKINLQPKTAPGIILKDLCCHCTYLRQMILSTVLRRLVCARNVRQNRFNLFGKKARNFQLWVGMPPCEGWNPNRAQPNMWYISFIFCDIEIREILTVCDFSGMKV